ncbi:MAG: carbohydrate binding domain-containing protein [bacterium]
MKRLIFLFLVFALFNVAYCLSVRDRFIWIFGFDFQKEEEIQKIKDILNVAKESGYNGVVFSAGLDMLCKQNETYFKNLKEFRDYCKKLNLELIPAVFSIGYGGGILAHNRNLAEGLPVVDALFIVKGNEAIFTPDSEVKILNGGFEEFSGNTFKHFNFHDQPGEVSFVDTQVKRSGNASIRFENFTANPYGHGRVMQEISLKPYRCYRMSLWVKTENLQPQGCFNLLVLADDRDLAPRTFNIPTTSDWTKVTMVFNSLKYNKVRVYAGVWGAKSGKFWLDDWTIEEIGPLNVLRRPGTPVVVRDEKSGEVYEEGKDYQPLIDPNFSFWNWDRPSLTLKILPGGRIKDGQRLRVSWYHPMVIYEWQVTVCMAEPEVYEIFDHEAKLLWENLRYNKVLLSHDEIRMGGTCLACKGKDMAKLLGESVTKTVNILRKYNPKAEIYIWSDMFDPYHNARKDYYLVEGDFTGSWKYIPKDLIIAVWGGEPREKSLEFFSQQGFKTLIACYYDAPNLDYVKGWLELSRKYKNITGFMYTTWDRKYELVKDFAELLWRQAK